MSTSTAIGFLIVLGFVALMAWGLSTLDRDMEGY